MIKMNFAVAATFFALSLYGVELPRVFGDNMVLQRSQRVPVWGKAKSGEKITVEFAGQSVSTEAGEDGKWLHFDYVPGEGDVREGSAAIIGRLCVIGSALNKAALSDLLGVTLK